WQEHAGRWQLVLSEKLYQQFLQTQHQLPLIVHGLSLSIGSASGWNESYLQLLEKLQVENKFCWHSEHLGFLDIVTPEGENFHAGSQLRMPFTSEAINLLVPRIRMLTEKFQSPFVLENTTYYLPGIAFDGMDEVDFLNALCGLSDGKFGLLLD